MSTRAMIAVRRDDAAYDAVYLHFDGYPDHTGKVLLRYHADRSAAQSLVAGGDIRSLDRVTGEAERFADGNPPTALPNQQALIEYARDCDAQFVYIFGDRTWTCCKL